MRQERKELKKTLKSKDMKSNCSRINMRDNQKISFKMKEIELIVNSRRTGERRRMNSLIMRMRRINLIKLS